MVLRSVAVENFRAIRSAELTLDPTTVLIGENDFGRSSLMEDIALALGWNAGCGEPDMECCFWRYGYADTLCRAAFPQASSIDAFTQRRAPPRP